MKSLLLVAFVSTFALVLAQSPESKEVERLFSNVTHFETLVQSIQSEFDLARSNADAREFQRVLTEIKSLKSSLHVLKEAVVTDMESDHLYHFWERIAASWIGIQLRGHEEALDSIAWEILGQQNGYSSFYQREFSELLKTIINLLDVRVSRIQIDIQEVDKLVRDGVKASLNGTKTDTAFRTKINGDFDKLVQLCNEARGELSRDYYYVTEQVRYGHRSLDRIQKMKVERFLDALYFTQTFVGEFKMVLGKLGVTD